MASSLITDLQRLLAPERVSDSPDDLVRYAAEALAPAAPHQSMAGWRRRLWFQA